MDQVETTDEQFLAQFVRGDRRGLGALAQRYERSMLGVARGLLGGRRELACDAVQEAWVRVIRFGHGFDGRASFKTWLYRIVVNQCRSLLGSRPPAEGDGAAGAVDIEVRPGPTAAPADEDGRLRAAVESLGEPQRETVLLCYHAGMTHEQAAEILEIPLGTLKSRLHAALTALRERLGRETEE